MSYLRDMQVFELFKGFPSRPNPCENTGKASYSLLADVYDVGNSQLYSLQT